MIMMMIVGRRSSINIHTHTCVRLIGIESQPDTIVAKQLKGLRRIMRPLKARGKEWVHSLNSGSNGRPATAGAISIIGASRSNSRMNAKREAPAEEDVDSDGSDMVRRVGNGVERGRSNKVG